MPEFKAGIPLPPGRMPRIRFPASGEPGIVRFERSSRQAHLCREAVCGHPIRSSAALLWGPRRLRRIRVIRMQFPYVQSPKHDTGERRRAVRTPELGAQTPLRFQASRDWARACDRHAKRSRQIFRGQNRSRESRLRKPSNAFARMMVGRRDETPLFTLRNDRPETGPSSTGRVIRASAQPARRRFPASFPQPLPSRSSRDAAGPRQRPSESFLSSKFSQSDSRRGLRTEWQRRSSASSRRQPRYSSS